MKFRSTFSACKIHCGTLGAFPVCVVSDEGNQRSHHCLHFLPAGSLGFFSVAWVFHHGLLAEVQAHTKVVTQFSNDGEPMHGQLGAQVERACIHPQPAEPALLQPKETPPRTQL